MAADNSTPGVGSAHVGHAKVRLFGIRHHGPGSARRLRAALDALRPACVLIEGPADASALLPRLADPAMRPPVALLSHAVNAPDRASFHPFAEFSPEYQAVLWAVRAGVPVRCIDLPSSAQVALREDGPACDEAEAAAGEDAAAPAEAAADARDADAPEPAEAESEGSHIAGSDAERDAGAHTDADTDAGALAIARDPIGAIARIAGYEDGESWWNDWVETLDAAEHDAAQAGDASPEDPFQVFEAVAEIMQALRDAAPPPSRLDAMREAHMRLQIAAAARETDGAVAVICGAWHVPALRGRHKAGQDRALLAGLPKQNMQQTWVPWTFPRLATASGYGAGVTAPRWYAHLWRHGARESGAARWLTAVARAFREGGAQVSTASVIEAVRMAAALARLRERPRIGFEELRDAAIACLCHGEALVWAQHEARLLLGDEVGAIPPDTPLMPLLDDLQRQQKTTRLKPEALPRELALDLRSDAGAARSVLLHRLRLLDVPWGRLEDAGRSRGTFRERWTLAWEPEFAVRLVEHLPLGPTIESAAAARSAERMAAEPRLSALAELIQACLEARLDAAADRGLDLLTERAGHAQECVELLAALSPLIALHRYGSAREMALAQLAGLIERMLVQAALALPHAARNLDAQQAEALCTALQDTHRALDMADAGEDAQAAWWRALMELATGGRSDLRVCGLACRLAYEAGRLEADHLQTLLRRMLSPGVATPEAARFFEGFFEQGAKRLLHDDTLLLIVDQWLQALDAEVFQEQLPLFRRVFAGLDAHERRRLLERTVRPQAAGDTAHRLLPAHYPQWCAHRDRVWALLRGEAT